MNVTSVARDQWLTEIQFGNIGAALFIITYIGCYGLGIICFFGQQLNEIQRQRSELPATFLKTLWDVPSKNKLYEELSDIDRLKRIFYCYFNEHESFTTINNNELQSLAEERAYACAIKYRQKIRRLHLSHTDYYSDTIPRLSVSETEFQEQIFRSLTLLGRTKTKQNEDQEYQYLSVSVV
ncbi:unnamed protein product [Adineta ricciae]|uniref:Uncharacterized protein n=1 Tax=Adineta ricciae TaxID=249248 RepID=A0A814SRJ7_ADIRI|nr:unnamed protein product [Adineta ricciae]CAF1151618.1 unnamed protein product [Adineta ricciae]